MTFASCRCGCPRDVHGDRAGGGRCAKAGCGCLAYTPAPGRPRGSTKDPEKARSDRLNVYVTPDEGRSLRADAASSAKSLSALVADRALDASGELAELREAVRLWAVWMASPDYCSGPRFEAAVEAMPERSRE